jgi:predicted LPLAT superfamily acyltransferase
MALVVFRSKAAAEIFMFTESARRLLQIMGKTDPDSERGVIRAEEVEQALNRLIAAVEQEKAAVREELTRRELDERSGAARSEALPPITLGQRAFPLIEMLRAALRKRVDVTWGV